MTTCVLFIQGGGKGAHSEDALLADALKQALGPKYDVCFPRMPGESDPSVESWKQKISLELSHTSGKVILVAHSVGGSILLRYLSEEKVGNQLRACSCLPPRHGMRIIGTSTTLRCRATLLRS